MTEIKRTLIAMKHRIVILLLCAVSILSAQQKPTLKWLDQKFSMFIHFGLYSHYGGVYDGKPVTRGYSEQIQSFAGIFSDWYADTAREFNPANWNPDSIVALAKKAGMRSIVFTSKHHDGFCMYHSRYTDFNIEDATPYKKDIMKELSDACRRGGVDFAVYFSLIDWHFPQAYPISSHNADPLTPEHYQFNLKQVEEIMSNYGPISEIWFDMGSLTPEQSKGLYDLVNRLQPQCMISGRLGNNYMDFSVMADNEYPDYKIGVPWQTAASMFDETWGYRSWQERGKVEDKVREKIASLVKVISRGGNYLLNIGPKGDGSVVEFEKEVLVKIGEWTKTHAEAIYGTITNPLPHTFEWGEITTKGNNLFLFIGQPAPTITLDGISGEVSAVTVLSTGENCSFIRDIRNNSITIQLPADLLQQEIYPVLKVSFRDHFTAIPPNIVRSGTLTPENAIPEFGHSSADYYCGYKSLTGYNWNFRNTRKQVSPEVCFTENEKGRAICVNIDGQMHETVLTPDRQSVERIKKNSVVCKNQYRKNEKGVFGYLEEENKGTVSIGDKWTKTDAAIGGAMRQLNLSPREGMVILQEIESTVSQQAAFEINSSSAAYILVNGVHITAYFPETEGIVQQKIIVIPLKKGRNQLVVKFFNRHTEKLSYSIHSLDEWVVYRKTLPSFGLNHSETHQLSVKDANPPSKVAPLELSNMRVKM